MKEGLKLNKKMDKGKLKRIYKSKKTENSILKEIQEQLGENIEFTYESKQALKKISKEVKNKNTKIKENSKIFDLEKLIKKKVKNIL